MNIELPENIRKILLNKEFKVNTVGKTNSQVYMYNNMVLKIQKNNLNNFHLIINQEHIMNYY